MSKYYEVTAIREYEHNGETKKSYTRLGVAFPFKDKDGFTVRLDAMPAPQDGTYTMMLFPPKPKDQPNDYANQSQGGTPSTEGIDSEIPF